MKTNLKRESFHHRLRIANRFTECELVFPSRISNSDFKDLTALTISIVDDFVNRKGLTYQSMTMEIIEKFGLYLIQTVSLFARGYFRYLRGRTLFNDD